MRVASNLHKLPFPVVTTEAGAAPAGAALHHFDSKSPEIFFIYSAVHLTCIGIGPGTKVNKVAWQTIMRTVPNFHKIPGVVAMHSGYALTTCGEGMMMTVVGSVTRVNLFASIY